MDHPVGGRGVADPLVAVDAVHRHRIHQTQLDHHDQHDPPPASFSHAIGSPSLTASQASYKQLKEAWIADQTGSSIHSINILGLVMLLTYAIWAVLRAKRIAFVRRQHRRQPGPILSAVTRLSDWQLEFLILIVPAVGAHTVLATRLVVTNAVLLGILGLLLSTGPPLPGRSRPEKKKHKRHWSKKDSDDSADDDTPLHRHVDTPAEVDLPFRVSVDSAADAAHAAAAPPTFYDGPGSDHDLSIDTSIDTSMRSVPQSPALGSARSTDGSLLSPGTASTSSHSSASRGELAALKTGSANLLHSRDGSDAQSAVSASSAMSPLARSVVDPWGKARQSPLDPSADPSTSQLASNPTSSAATSPLRSGLHTDRNLFVQPQPFLTVYRAHMMLVTIISILAVDFPVFPRAMSKCESFGTSWMDMGVGSFVFSLGLISALPFLRSPRNRFRPLKQQLVADFRRSLPLLLLGGVRVVMVKGVEYPEHVSEYGVHWNFFITLSVLPFAATLSRPFARSIRYSVLGLTLSLVHQILLSTTEWQDWALSNTLPRTNFWSANKEGVTSMVGYLAIFYIALDIGHYVLPLDPYYAYRKLRRRRARPRTDKLAMILASLAVLWWTAYAASHLASWRVSRRLANMPYVLWVAAFNTTFLLGYVSVYLWVLQPLGEDEEMTPAVLEDLNRHSLGVFLAANVLTGLVNMMMRTMYAGDVVALGLLVGYTGVCCGLARWLTKRGWRIRL